MKSTVSMSAARAAAMSAVVARVFLGLVVDAPTTHNGAWLCALLGALLAAPWLLCLAPLRGYTRASRLPLDLVLMLAAMIDAATVMSTLTRSAGYLALDRSPALTLALPAALAVLWCVWRGGDAIGYGAILTTRIVFALVLVVVLLQWHYFRPQWLSPVLGNGIASIVDGGVRAASWIVASASILAVADDEGSEACASLSVLPALGIAAVACSVLIALRQMLTPTQISDWTWLNRLDALLCNGRTPLYLQLPMIALWFAGLLHLLVSECFAASAIMGRLLPQLDPRLCGASVVTATLFLSRSPLAEAWRAFFSTYGFLIVAFATALALALPTHQKEP